MDRSSLIVVVIPIVIPIALFTGMALPFVAASRSGRSHARRRLASADARERTGAAGRKARPQKPRAHDDALAGYLYVPCVHNRHNDYSAGTRRWVQQVPIVKKTAKLIYYTSDSWDRTRGRRQPRLHQPRTVRDRHPVPRYLPQGYRRGPGVRPARPRAPPLRACPGPGPSLPRARRLRGRLPGRHLRLAVRTARLHMGALPARGRPVPSRIPGRRDPGSRPPPPPRTGRPALLRHPPGRRRPPALQRKRASPTGRTASTAHQGTAPRDGRRPPRPWRHRRAVHPSAPPVSDSAPGRARVTCPPRRPWQTRPRTPRDEHMTAPAKECPPVTGRTARRP